MKSFKLSHKLEHYRAMIDATLADYNLTRDDILTGRDAWAVAHKAGVTRDAYDISRDICDAHIQTALAALMPRAVFKDVKRY